MCHLLVIQRGGVPTNLWHSHGFSCLSHCCQPGDGGRGTESTRHQRSPTPILEEVCGRHPNGPPHRPDPEVPSTSKLNWVYHSVYHRRGLWRSTAIPLLPHWQPIMMMGPCRHQCSGRRLTWTGTSILSHHPLAHKAAVARTLLTRVDRICTDFPDKAKEKEHFTQVLRMNGYPRELVTKNWEPTARPHQPEVSDTPKAKVVLLYVRHLSETIQRILTPLGVYTCFRPSTPSVGLWCT